MQDKLDRVVAEKVKLADELQNCRVYIRKTDERAQSAEIHRD